MPQPPSEQAPLASCSFCLRPNAAVGTLVAGPGVFICNDCVALAEAVIADKPAKVERLALWEHPMSDDELLALLPRVAAAGAQVERTLTALVHKARSQRVTWARIGQALDMTRQSAWGRFSSEE